MNILITATVAGLAWWAQARHDAAHTGRAYGHGDLVNYDPRIVSCNLDCTGPRCPMGMAAGDVDGDGQTEIVFVGGRIYMGGGGPYPMHLGVYGYNGSTITQEHLIPLGPDGGCSPALVDMNLDRFWGDPDAIYHTGTEGWLWAYRLRNPLPIKSFDLMAPVLSSSPAVADLDNDGDHDVVVCVSDLWGNGVIKAVDLMSEALLWQYHANNDAPIYSTPAIGDVNNDGKNEVVVIDGWGKLYLLNGSNGSVIMSKELVSQPSPVDLAGFASPVLANLDEHPDLEIIAITAVPNGTGGTVTLYAIDQSGSILWQYSMTVNGWWNSIDLPDGIPHWASPAVGDLNNDGYNDVVVAVNDPNGYDKVYALDIKNKTPLFDPLIYGPTEPSMGGYVIPGLALGDVDGNTTTLEIVLCTSSSYPYLHIISNTGQELRILSMPDVISTAYCPPMLADVDDDGRLEVVWAAGKSDGDYLFVFDGGDPIGPSNWVWSRCSLPLGSFFQSFDQYTRLYDAAIARPRDEESPYKDPNDTSSRVVAVGGYDRDYWLGLPTDFLVFYSTDMGGTWKVSSHTPYGDRPCADAGQIVLYGVDFMDDKEGLAVGYVVLISPLHDDSLKASPYFKRGIIMRTTDGGASWKDITHGALFGPGFGPERCSETIPALTDVIITAPDDGISTPRAWIVGLWGTIITGVYNPLSPYGWSFYPPMGEWRQVSSCYDFWGVNAYYPSPGVNADSVWITGVNTITSLGMLLGKAGWNGASITFNPLPLPNQGILHDAIYDLWAQGAEMPSLADISDSIFAVGEVIKDVGSGGILLYQNKYPGAVPTELEYYWADPYQGYSLIPAFRDISTPNEPYLERYVVGWPRIYKWTVNYTEAGKYLPDAIGTDAVFLRPDEVGVNTQRFLWGSADNGNFAVGYDYLDNDPNFRPAPCVWRKQVGIAQPPPVVVQGTPLPPRLTKAKTQQRKCGSCGAYIANLSWDTDTGTDIKMFLWRVYPVTATPPKEYTGLTEMPYATYFIAPNDTGYWDRVGVKALGYFDNESQASDDLGDTSLFYHPGPGAVSDTLALFPSSSENLVMDNDGVAHLVYASRSLEDGEYHIYYIYRPFGGSWSEPQDLGRGYAPTIAFWNDTSDFAGATLLLAYTVHQGKTSKLMMRKKSPGGSWSPARMLAVFNPSSPYLGMGAPDILDVFRGGQTPVFMGAGDPPRAYVALKAPLRDGRKDRVKGYRLLLWSVDPVSLNAVGPEIVDSLSVVPFDVPDREAFLAGVGGVSITGIKVFNQYHQHIAWDCDGDSLSVLWRRNPGYPWSRMDLSGCFYGYANEAKEPYVMAVGGASAPPDTYSVIYITFCGRNNNAQPYSVYLSTLFTHQPAGFPWRVSDGKSDTKNPILSGWNWWSQNVGGDWEVFKGNPWGYRVLISKTPWARSIYPQYTWGTNPYYEVALYLEEDPKDGECGLIRRGYEPSPITSQMWSFGDPFPTPATLERGGFIVYDTVAPALTVDTASSRLSYILPDWNLRDGEEYALVLVFYHQEPDTQALRAVICSDTYTVYVPPNEEYFWQTNVVAHSPISLSVEKLGGARAFLSGAYLVPTGEGKGGPQSQGLGGLSFSLSACPTVSKGIFSIRLSLPLRQEIDLSLYDVTGRMALSVAKGVYAPGTYTFTVSPRQLSSGIYYLRLVSPQYRETKKLILTK